MKKQFKHVNPKILLRKVYTEQGGVKEYNKNQQVGHKISDITEKVYTQREFEWLKTEIEKIR